MQIFQIYSMLDHLNVYQNLFFNFCISNRAKSIVLKFCFIFAIQKRAGLYS